MSAERYTFDTNVLFYSLDPEAGTKHRAASHLIETADPEKVVLTLQSLSELCNSVRRKRFSLVSLADEFVSNSTDLFDIVAASASDLADAMMAGREHKIPFWDAMLWATARRAGCTLLLSEDFQDGQVLGGVTIRNPFVMSSSQLNALLK